MIQYKKTLPLVYFYNYLSQGSTDSSSGIISAELNKQSSHEVYHGFKDSGADIFCAIVAETFLNRAKKNLAALKDRVRTLEGLEQFIGSFEINPDEILVAA